MDKNQKLQFRHIGQKYNINTIYIFGSQATGKAHKNSDFDFAIQFDKKVHPEDYFGIKLNLFDGLQKIVRAENIDVVIMDESGTPIALKYRVIKDGKILYVKDDILRSRMEHKIMKLYFDRQYYSKRYMEYSLKHIAEHGILC
jgi:uncharacterized protein